MIEEISLSNRLPFEDDTFDHVHIVHVSKGVPEHKVNSFRSRKWLRQLLYYATVELSLRGGFLNLQNSPTYSHGCRKFAG
jgi:hypothetical protein